MHKGMFQAWTDLLSLGNRLPKVTCILSWMTKYHSNAGITKISGASEMSDKNKNGKRPK